MSELLIAEFRWLLAEELVESYDMTQEEATYAIQNSYVKDLLEELPDFALHYSIKDTAKDVWREYKGIPIEI